MLISDAAQLGTHWATLSLPQSSGIRGEGGADRQPEQVASASGLWEEEGATGELAETLKRPQQRGQGSQLHC